jgi:hypothetical protein
MVNSLRDYFNVEFMLLNILFRTEYNGSSVGNVQLNVVIPVLPCLFSHREEYLFISWFQSIVSSELSGIRVEDDHMIT